MAEALRQKTNLEIAQQALDMELFSPLSEAYYMFNVGFIHGKSFPRERLVLTLVVLLPIVVILVAMYKAMNRYYNDVGEKLWYRSHFYYPLLLLTILPQYALNIDWGRWQIATTTVVFFEVFYLIYKNDAGALASADKLNCFIDRHKVIAIFTLVYIASINKFLGAEFPYQVGAIVNRLLKMGFLRIS